MKKTETFGKLLAFALILCMISCGTGALAAVPGTSGLDRAAPESLREESPDQLTSISLEVFREDIFVGDRPLIRITGHFSNGQEQDITEDEEYPVSGTSTDPDVISVEEEDILARAPGKARIDVAVSAEIRASVDFTVHEVSSAKARRSYCTEEKIAAARENVANYDWAAATANGEIEKADQYLAQYSLDDLWIETALAMKLRPATMTFGWTTMRSWRIPWKDTTGMKKRIYMRMSSSAKCLPAKPG